MKLQETLFQERCWAQGRPGDFRETRREARLPGIRHLGLGRGLTLRGPGPGTFAGPLPGGYDGPPESATLAGVQGSDIQSKMITGRAPLVFQQTHRLLALNPDVPSGLKTFC